MKRYTQLTREQRYQIEALLSIGCSTAEIGRRLGKHRSTIHRELVRNGRLRDGWRYYTAHTAHKQSLQRRADTGARRRKIRGPVKRLVEAKLRQGWSPEQICGRVLLELGQRLSHESIYRHVLRDAQSHGPLRYCLRRSGYKYNHSRFRKTNHQRLPKPPRCTVRTIDQRPQAANDRAERGHWERDLVLSRRPGPALLLIVDRRSTYTLVRWIRRPTAKIVDQQTIEALKPFACVNKTLTNDNGSEFKNPDPVERALGFPVYFTDPASPWQRGIVENTAGLVRQYFPKRCKQRWCESDRWIAPAIEQTLNTRPRRSLGYRTPHEVFFDRQLSLLAGPMSHLGLETSWPSRYPLAYTETLLRLSEKSRQSHLDTLRSPPQRIEPCNSARRAKTTVHQRRAPTSARAPRREASRHGPRKARPRTLHAPPTRAKRPQAASLPSRR